MPTHEVINQVPPLTGHNVLLADPALVESLDRWGDPEQRSATEQLGLLAGTEQAQEWGRLANEHEPVLRTISPQGARIDEVEFHPAWHELMRAGVGAGLGGEAWTRPAGSGAHATRAAGFLVWSQVEQGHLCPITMTAAAVPALRNAPELATEWEAGLASRDYDFGLRPWRDKGGLVAGMGMTEKQGGSDVRSNTTYAVPTPGGPLPGTTYRLTGHKWFCSAPMSDGFLILGQTPEGVSCFLVPRVLGDNTRNVFAIQRLKDKLGNRSNASSEIELDGTWGSLVGEAGRGVRTIIDMVAATRLDCVLGSTSIMRQALVRAVHHARHRSAFGAALVDQPLMRNVLTDLALESEAATALAMRLAHAVDQGDTAFARMAVAVSKYWVCKRTPVMVAEALECLGGNGYVEENGVARLYREAPLNSIWEGSGNVNALDVLRAVARQPTAVEAFTKELALAKGVDPELDRAIDELDSLVAQAQNDDGQLLARHVVERLALTLQAALLVQHAPSAVAELFVASRLTGRRGMCFGTLDAGAVAAQGSSITDRALAL